MLTWGDGVADIDLHDLLALPPQPRKARDGDGGPAAGPVRAHGPRRRRVSEFSEKPQTGEGWINGAFFVLEPAVLDYIDGDETQWERQPLERLASEGQLMAYQHDGFWQCMDTLRDRKLLRDLWDGGRAPWKMWG